MASPLLIRLRPRPLAIAYRPAFERVNGTTILEWCLRRFADAAPDRQRMLLTAPHEHRLAQPMLAATATTAAESNAVDDLGALLDAAARYGWSEVIFATLETAFASESLIPELLARHDAGRCGATIVTGAPHGIEASILRLSVLRPIAMLPSGHRPDSVRSALALLDLWFPATAPGKEPSEICHVPYERLSSAAPAAVPRRVQLTSAADVAAAAAAIGAASDRLAAWQQARERDLPAPIVVNPGATGHRSEPRVLFVSNPAAFSGSERALVTLIKYVARVSAWRTAAVVSFEGEFTDQLRRHGCEVFCRNEALDLDDSSSCRYLARVIQAWQPAVLHCNRPIPLAGHAVADEAGLPVVVHARLPDMTPWGASLGAAQRVIAVSKLVAASVEACNVPAPRIRLVYDAIDEDVFSPERIDPATARDQLGLDRRERVIAIVGRVAAIKRHDLLIDAVAQLTGAGMEHVTLLIVGEPHAPCNTIESVRRALQRTGLVDRTRIIDFTPDVRGVIGASDVLVCCSDNEPFGLSLLEAMALDVPVVMTDKTGCLEALPPLAPVHVVPCGDAGALARALAQVLSDPEAKARAAVFGRSVRSELGAGRMARETIAIWDELAAAAAPPRSAVEAQTL